MTKLDDELKQALNDLDANGAAETGGHAVPAQADAPRPSGDSSRRNVGLLLSLLVIGGGLLAFVLGQDSEQLVYSKGVDEVVANRAELSKRNLRVQGILVHGSLMKRDQPCEFRFKVRPKDAPDGAQLEVHYASCIVPDTFRDVAGMDVEVTAEGQLAGEHLAATQIFAKCPSKYEMQQRQASGEAAPHGMPAPGGSPMNSIPEIKQGS